MLQRLLETLICSLEREADAERRREDNIRRLRLPGCRSDHVLHIGDLIYTKSDCPAPYARFVQLAVLRRIHRSGCKVDVQLCDISPPEMGTNGVDRIRLRTWLRGLPTTSILGGVEPLVFADPNRVPPQGYSRTERERKAYPRELWSTLQLWNAAELALKATDMARTRLYHDLPAPGKGCRCHFWGCSFFRGQSCAASCTMLRVPRLSELAEAALPAFLEKESKLWKSAIAPLRDGEIERAAEREQELRGL